MRACHDASHSYADLTPHAVLDALDAVGLRGDGRMLQLNSYENRVFQVILEDGGAVVAKFYRPGRWSDAQILEEHAFALELAAAEVPVVAPLVLQADAGADVLAAAGDPPTLALRTDADGAAPLRVSPRCAGRAPELEDAGHAGAGSAASSAGCMRWARASPSRTGTTLDAPRRRPARRDAAAATATSSPPTERPPGADACAARAGRCRRRLRRAPPPATLRLHGDCHPGNMLWRDAGPHVVDLDDACMGPAVQDLWMLLSGDARRDGAAAATRCCAATSSSWTSTDRELRADRAAAHAAHDPPQRLAGAALERPGLPARLPVVRQLGLLGPADARSCASSSTRWPRRRSSLAALLDGRPRSGRQQRG